MVAESKGENYKNDSLSKIGIFTQMPTDRAPNSGQGWKNIEKKLFDDEFLY